MAGFRTRQTRVRTHPEFTGTIPPVIALAALAR
jgi:hypothetical protein